MRALEVLSGFLMGVCGVLLLIGAGDARFRALVFALLILCCVIQVVLALRKKWKSWERRFAELECCIRLIGRHLYGDEEWDDMEDFRSRYFYDPLTPEQEAKMKAELDAAAKRKNASTVAKAQPRPVNTKQ